MTDQATQPVASDAPAVAQPTAPAPDARTDLDSLLAEFESGTRPVSPQTQPDPQKPAIPADVADRMQKLERTLAEQSFEREFAPVRDRIRGDIPKDVLSDEEITDLLNGRAMRDTRLRAAWENRAANPRAWSSIEKSLNQELSTKFKKLPDPTATDDVAAVTAAVRGASQRPPEGKAPNFGAMTNNEGREAVKKEYGFDPGW